MNRLLRIVVIIGLAIALLGADPAAGAPRRRVDTPWAKSDSVGEAFRPQGDLRRVIVDNRRPRVTFTFRMVAQPIWDTDMTSHATFMQFRLDWLGGGPGYNRRVTVSFGDDGFWHIVVFDGQGGALCLQDGGVQSLGGFRYRFSVPTQMCLGGAHVLRVAASFADDQSDDATDVIKLDRVPNSGGYGPFIRLP